MNASYSAINKMLNDAVAWYKEYVSEWGINF